MPTPDQIVSSQYRYGQTSTTTPTSPTVTATTTPTEPTSEYYQSQIEQGHWVPPDRVTQDVPTLPSPTPAPAPTYVEKTVAVQPYRYSSPDLVVSGYRKGAEPSGPAEEKTFLFEAPTIEPGYTPPVEWTATKVSDIEITEPQFDLFQVTVPTRGGLLTTESFTGRLYKAGQPELAGFVGSFESVFAPSIPSLWNPLTDPIANIASGSPIGTPSPQTEFLRRNQAYATGALAGEATQLFLPSAVAKTKELWTGYRAPAITTKAQLMKELEFERMFHAEPGLEKIAIQQEVKEGARVARVGDKSLMQRPYVDISDIPAEPSHIGYVYERIPKPRAETEWAQFNAAKAKRWPSGGLNYEQTVKRFSQEVDEIDRLKFKPYDMENENLWRRLESEVMRPSYSSSITKSVKSQVGLGLGIGVGLSTVGAVRSAFPAGVSWAPESYVGMAGSIASPILSMESMRALIPATLSKSQAKITPITSPLTKMGIDARMKIDEDAIQTPRIAITQMPRVKQSPIQTPKLDIPTPTPTKTSLKAAPPVIPEFRIKRKPETKIFAPPKMGRHYREWSHTFNFEALGYSPKMAKKIGRLYDAMQ